MTCTYEKMERYTTLNQCGTVRPIHRVRDGEADSRVRDSVVHDGGT